MALPVNNPPQGQQRKGDEIIYGNVPAQTTTDYSSLSDDDLLKLGGYKL